MKRLFAACLAVCLGLGLAACQSGETAPAGPVTIAVASDLHYVGTEIENGGELFRQAVEYGDGRQLDYIRPITDALIAGLLEEKPQALILTGDLSFNGEENSHRELAEKLQALVDAGIGVYVLPGNHDINNYAASAYIDDERLPADPVTPEQFQEIYKNCGFAAAHSRDKASLSYMVKLNAGVWLFMLDAEQYADHSPGLPYLVGGKLQDETYKWLEKQLKQCKAAGAVPLVALHQNLTDHFEGFSNGYTLFENHRLGELLAQYGGQLAFSGHLHPQHIAQWQSESGQTVYDIASESLAVWPYLSGRVTIEPDGAGFAAYDYEATPTDVTAWAAATGQTDPVYADFSAWGRAQFEHNSTTRSRQAVIEALGQQDGEAFCRVMGQVNALYFGGMLTRQQAGQILAGPDWPAVEKALEKGVEMAGYIQRRIENAGGEHCALTLP